MTCFNPLQAFKSDFKLLNGKLEILWNRPSRDYSEISLPCGQCVGCRLERSRQWAMRIVHESKSHSENCFITLTFNEDNLSSRPVPESVDVRDFQLFMKRLRKHFSPRSIRFFHCGEYGSKSLRPHYHACLFNIDFPDKVLYSVNNDNPLYTSAILSQLWPFGFSTVGSLTFDSAAYTARYIMKKITGPASFEVYNKVDFDTGEILSTRLPEYVTMSRRPGIGKAWIDKYQSFVYFGGGDTVNVNNSRCRPPRYYDNQLELSDPFHFQDIKAVRSERARINSADNSSVRLDVRKKCLLSRIKALKRSLD